MSNYVAVISLVLLSGYVRCLPDGAPASACSDMVPGHLPTSVKGEPPYQINVNGASYQPGTPLTGSITSPSDHVILGVLLEARSVADPSQLVGEFTPASEDFKTVCGDNHKSAMTHANPNKKSNVTFSWNPPSTTGDEIIFSLENNQSVILTIGINVINNKTIFDQSVVTFIDGSVNLICLLPSTKHQVPKIIQKSNRFLQSMVPDNTSGDAS